MKKITAFLISLVISAALLFIFRSNIWLAITFTVFVGISVAGLFSSFAK
ncbi:hypothetical protein ABZU09_07170 [Lactobacillus mulieris]|jgi:hypothetical protein|uniref:Uncharacterized protein n=1 Tax=Lactobacillus mulieris TaxID=2508708 RepID=A0AAP3M386_9LACO|nr:MULTISPECIES: hypothetical protein [Lactobacillus]EQM96002.1 hypothetical protein HMPREF0525_01496 [Lactobacillus jensenii 27-2-CHN]QGR95383.1 hypothetical protein FOC57_00755 [Lactobacillus jensenii]MCF1782931.1 hypothetical protein [Lactobacillus mulieris]MCF1798019.1 hypothetical protein [Lactobacillus mulieris]MCF1846564.1 hypothetical protein [Lactobacillus mulieris]